ncbi:hypothetical protein [Flavobacterium sp. CSZ]|uniref:hypothetical protein n=1 Tax=Flavobacterium sp. CSZ TaxID=2783791 RepID=UPI00188A9476|nr:hypothetical protein [Flavobacterium sp. CSZ]MBF4484357.1 hypothetical protein [Flavobacterium sp. CSZ]
MNTKEQITEKFKNWLKKTKVISFDERIGFNCWDKELTKLRDGKTLKEIYIVSFSTESKVGYDENGEMNFFVDGMLCFAYFDAETLELLYIQKKAGYIEVDGSY